DYVVNYFEGDVTFTDVKGLGDYIEIVYEFTNPIEDFIPVLSKKNFFGAQFLWKATPVADTVPRIAKGTETYELTPSSNQGLVGSMNIELKNSPIVLGSEILLLNGQTLRRNIDYVLRNRKGRISFLKRPLASGDSISVNYDYYVTQDYSDDLIANDKPGPYTLTNSNVLDGSVKIWIDQKPAKEIVDYTIDYDNGQIQFSYPVSYPSIITARYRAVVVDAINDPTKPAASPINFGVTYLDEYVKGQSEELTLQITSENITSTQDTFSLANNPIVEVDKLVMTINDVPAVSGDYRIVNAYTGTIALTTPNPSARISVSYKYRKSFQTTYVFVAPNESPNLYINNTTPGFIMRDLPVKYKGIRKIRVYDGFTDPELIENQDYTVNYGSDGNSIGITFYKVGDIPPVPGVTITRTSYPQPGNRITIVYDNPPGASPDAGDISQKQVGVTFGTQLNKNWRIDTELSAAENNFSKPRLQTEITLPGHGNTEPYLMGQRNIVENSETVYVDNVPLVKDQQYSMNYVNGTFRFINLTPLAQNTIRVRFSYINPTGNTVAGTGSGFKAATKLGTSFKDGRWSLKADVKTIDKDYLPLSPILDKKGTTSFGGAVEYKVNEQNFLAVDYRRRDEYVPPSDDRNNVYSHYDDVNVKGRVRLFDGIDVRQNVRYGTQFQDPLSSTATTNRYAIDTAGVNWDTGVEFGNPDARHVFSRGYSKSVEGYLDGFNRREVETDSLRWNGTFRFKNWYGLGTTSLSPAWEYSSSTTRQLNSATGESGFGRAGRKFLGINSLYQPFSFWDGQVNISTEEQIAEVNGVAGSPARVNNTHTETNFRPFYWINTFASYDNREEFSPLIGQKGKRSNDLKYRIGSFSPQGFLVSAGAPAWASAPFTNSNFTYDLSLSDSKENNDLKSITNQSQTVAYNGFAPVPGFVLNRISYTSQLTQTFDLAGTQTSSQNATNRRYRQLAGNLSYRPAIPILQWFAYNLSLEKRAENRSNETTATVGTSNRTLDNVPFESRVQSLSFDPGRIVFGIPGIFGINLGSLRTTVEEFLQESTSIQNIQYAVNDP
ncbi:hypothetical protein EBR96_05635, partial [bacterium]|nr:hypothetical protein [bacterium]